MRCTSCHEGETYTIEAIPADAAPTIANETPNILHAGTQQHAEGETATPPIRSACLSCHDTPFAKEHADAFTSGLTERCAECHTEGKLAAVKSSHGLQ